MTQLAMILMSQPQGGQNPTDSLISTLIMFALIIGIFYFMILRPQQKRQKERQKMLDQVKKGDKVVTAGGLHGTVAGIDEKTILLQVADNVKELFGESSQSRGRFYFYYDDYYGGRRGGGEDRTKVTVTANTRSNSLTVVASPEKMKSIEERIL